MRAEQLLILDRDEFAERAKGLFNQIQTSAGYREYFVANPVGVIHEAIFGGSSSLDHAGINQGNRILFSLLSNPRFVEWARTFEEQIDHEVVQALESGDKDALRLIATRLHRDKLYPEVIKSIFEFGDPELLYSVTVRDPDDPLRNQTVRIAPGPGPIIGHGPISDAYVCVETFVYAVGAVAVFVAAVIAVVLERSFGSPFENLTRADLLRVSQFVANGLRERAQAVRNAGYLTSFRSAQSGAVL
jgi:hypothetical protein